ncbi:hypothetical protein TIFTF001_020232 [Ficus carica]|uniref:Uncharacterized protein n=1 Tax=Ficus carica TaxID=3494 RepID=A0AA88DAV0_FICCA|nr:hypothetical protein TIFTF001_020232 [Ficus carica]
MEEGARGVLEVESSVGGSWFCLELGGALALPPLLRGVWSENLVQQGGDKVSLSLVSSLGHHSISSLKTRHHIKAIISGPIKVNHGSTILYVTGDSWSLNYHASKEQEIDVDNPRQSLARLGSGTTTHDPGYCGSYLNSP